VDTQELYDVRQKLRLFASDHGMQWVLNEVDEAASLGISESRTLRQFTRQGQITYEDVTDVDDLDYAIPGRVRRGTEEFARRRPMTDLEQAELLVTALRRVLVDLDGIADEAVKVLNYPVDREQGDFSDQAKLEDIILPELPPVSEIAFVPDEGSTSPPISTGVMRDLERSSSAADLLAQIDREIRS
jgi:hypothetical protein